MSEGDMMIDYAKMLAPMTYEFYRGFLKGLLDAITDSNIEDTHPGLDALVNHVVASIICDSHRERQEREEATKSLVKPLANKEKGEKVGE